MRRQIRVQNGGKVQLRAPWWDYRTPAWYFVTMVTKEREQFFGEIRNGMMGLSKTGILAWHNWLAIPDHFDHVTLDTAIVMPDHMHGLIGIMAYPPGNGASKRDKGTRFGNPKPGSLSTILNQFKGSVTRTARSTGAPNFGWQPRFHDRIVRNNTERYRIRNYIRTNPDRWRGKG